MNFTTHRTIWWLIVMLVLAGCQRGAADAADIALKLAVTPNPPQIGVARVVATLNDAAGQPVRGAQVEFEGNMSHAGMAPVLATPAETAPGRYEAALDFGMSGEWVLIVRATLKDGRTIERQVSIGNVSAP